MNILIDMLSSHLPARDDRPPPTTGAAYVVALLLVTCSSTCCDRRLLMVYSLVVCIVMVWSVVTVPVFPDILFIYLYSINCWPRRHPCLTLVVWYELYIISTLYLMCILYLPLF